MKQGLVTVHTIKCLVLGIAGVGKTCLKRLLLSENTCTARNSTGVAENPVQVLVGSSFSSQIACVEEESTGRWEVLDENKRIQVLARACKVKQDSLSKAPSSPRRDELSEQTFEEIVSAFINGYKTRTGAKVNLIHFIDSGGQPEFLDLLPAFVQDVSVILFVINLSEKLNDCPMISFYKDNKQLGCQYKSSVSHRQVLEQCVRVAHARNVHPKVFVVGTHRDKAYNCPESKQEKDRIIREVMGVYKTYLIHKQGIELMYDVNSENPNQYDIETAHMLKQAIVAQCRVETSTPMQWYCFERLVRCEATQGLVTMSDCQKLAERLDIDKEGLKNALLHMVKYNVFLWYHDVKGLEDVVFCDPQVILKIITALVQCKHELAGAGNALSFSDGVSDIWLEKLRDHAIVSHEFLYLQKFREYFVNDVFSVQNFTTLMCHLFIMVLLEDGSYLMPALLDPLNPEKLCRKSSEVAPLLVCIPDACVPYGRFSKLLVFLLKECVFVKKDNVPVCLYRNCASFQLKTFPAQFTIIDSVAYIEVHLESGECIKEACPRIRKLIHDGILSCAGVLHYSGGKDLNDGFFCSNESCRHAASPYKEKPRMARCCFCSQIMNLTDMHTVWLNNEGMCIFTD